MSLPDSASNPVPTPLPTKIVAVTVYPDQARVTRRGQLAVTPSLCLLEMDLPSGLQVETVQTQARGTAEYQLQKPRVTAIPEVAAKEHPAAQELSDRLQELEKNCRRTQDDLAGLVLQRTFLENLTARSARTLAQELAQPAAGLSLVTQYLEFLEQTYTRIATAIAAQERLQTILETQMQALKADLQTLPERDRPTAYRVQIPVRVTAPGTLELTLIYRVQEVQWQPIYEVHLDAEHPGMQIDFVAHLQQQTGEPWEQVELTVSTSAPGHPLMPPEPEPWQIHPTTPKRPLDRRSADSPRLRTRSSSVLDDAYRMLGAVPGSEIPAAAQETAESSGVPLGATTAIMNFVAPMPMTVSTGTEVQPVTLGHLQVVGEFTYRAFPQQLPAPYRQVRFTLPSDHLPLLPGMVHLFQSGGYLGTVPMAYVAPGESCQFSLGLDERIIMQRDRVVKETYLDKQCQDRRAYRVTLHNPLSYVIRVTVVEQMPVSCTENIQVYLEKTDPAIAQSTKGVCQWTVDIEPQATQYLYYQYVVEHPPDVLVAGLDR